MVQLQSRDSPHMVDAIFERMMQQQLAGRTAHCPYPLLFCFGVSEAAQPDLPHLLKNRTPTAPVQASGKTAAEMQPGRPRRVLTFGHSKGFPNAAESRDSRSSKDVKGSNWDKIPGLAQSRRSPSRPKRSAICCLAQ